MKLNCRVGDLARLVESPFMPERVGLIVEVLRVAPAHLQGYGFAWNCKPAWPVVCIDDVTNKRRLTGKASEVAIPDAWLRPIKPGDLDDSEDTRAGKPNETVRDIIQEVAA